MLSIHFSLGKQKWKENGRAAPSGKSRKVVAPDQPATKSVYPSENFYVAQGDHTTNVNTCHGLHDGGKVINKAFTESKEHNKGPVNIQGKGQTRGNLEEAQPVQGEQKSLETDVLGVTLISEKDKKCSSERTRELLDGIPFERAVRVNRQLTKSKTDFLKSKIVHLALQ